MTDFARRQFRHWRGAVITNGPAVFWLLIFLLIPLWIVGTISFLSRGDYGEIQRPFTLENYKRLLGFGTFGFDSLYPFIFLSSMLLSATTAFICVAAGLPLAFFIARLPPFGRNTALLLVVIPFWTNLLIRTYAWQLLLSPESWIVRMANALSIGVPGEAFYPGTFAVLLGMVCDYLPFLVLPLYASVEKIDWSVAEAAADLGAHRFAVYRHAVLPQIAPGLIAGIVLVFLPALGQFVISDLLGGAKTVMLGNVIQQQFTQSRDWQFGSALSFVALGLVTLGLFIYLRKTRDNAEEIT